MITASALFQHHTEPWYFAIPAVALVGVRIWLSRRRRGGSNRGGGKPFGGDSNNKDPFDDQR